MADPIDPKRKHLFQKGRKKTGGRKRGTPNKMTVDLDNALAYGATQMEGWFKRGQKKAPLRAAEVWSKVAEYRLPKLARMEMKNADDKPFTIEKVVYVKVGLDGKPIKEE